MPHRCLNCNKLLPKGVQSTFCSRQCWQEYKEKRGFSLSPEKQATIMIKEQGSNLISSLKSEIEKKEEIIRHQDNLLREYRDSLESREREIDRLHRKLKQLERINLELKANLKHVSKPLSPVSSASLSSSRVKEYQTSPSSNQQMPPMEKKEPGLSKTAETVQHVPKLSFWKRIRIFFLGY